MSTITPVRSRTDEYGQQYERGISSLGHVIRHERDSGTPIVPFIEEGEQRDYDDDLADSVVLDDDLFNGPDPDQTSNYDQRYISDTQSIKPGDNETITPVYQ